MPKTAEHAALERAFENHAIPKDALEAFVAAVDHAGMELRPRGGEKRAEIVGTVQAERFKIAGVPGGYVLSVALPGRGWLVWNERQCCAGRNRHCDPPIFIAGDGGAFLGALPNGGQP